jgi:hypothetical protein
MIVPGGGLSADGEHWIAAKPTFFLPVFVLSKLFRRLMLEKLVAAHAAGKLNFYGDQADLADANAFTAFLAPLRKTRWYGPPCLWHPRHGPSSETLHRRRHRV